MTALVILLMTSIIYSTLREAGIAPDVSADQGCWFLLAVGVTVLSVVRDLWTWVAAMKETIQ